MQLYASYAKRSTDYVVVVYFSFFWGGVGLDLFRDIIRLWRASFFQTSTNSMSPQKEGGQYAGVQVAHCTRRRQVVLLN
jgi:hypothetical protein